MKNIKTKMSLKERVLVTICPMSSKIVCRTYDVSDYKSSATPADWKLQSSAQKWHRLRCGVSVDIKFPIRSKESGNLTLQTQIEYSLRPYFETVQNAVVLLNGIQRNEDESLDISTEGKKSKKKQSIEHSMSEWQEVQLYLPLKKESISQSEIFTATSMMTFKGVVQCRGYVHGKATVQEAIDAIKQDIIRSITARCEIHCEDLLLIEEEQSDPLVVHELPRRVFAPLPQAEICVCDYQFHNDTASGSIDAFKELLDLEISEEEIDSSCEVSPTTSTLILPEAADDRLSEFGDGPVQGSSMKLAPVIGVAITIAVGVLAFLFKSDWS